MKKLVSATMLAALLAAGVPSAFANESGDLTQWRQTLKQSTDISAEQKAQYEQLISRLQEQGDYKQALDVYKEMLERYYDKKDRTQMQKLGRLLQANKVDGITAVVDGKVVEADAAPFVHDGRTMVPVRAIGAALDADVTWKEDDRSVQIKRGEDVIILYADKKEALVNNQKVELETPPVIKDGRVFLPLRFVSEQLDTQVEWQEQGKVVIIDDLQKGDAETAGVSTPPASANPSTPAGPSTPANPAAPAVPSTPAATPAGHDKEVQHGFNMPGLGQGTIYVMTQNKDLLSLLGMTAAELQRELQAGRTLEEIAEDQDVDVDDVIDLLVEQEEERLEDRVDDGRLTEEEAEEIREDLQDDIEDLVERSL